MSPFEKKRKENNYAYDMQFASISFKIIEERQQNTVANKWATTRNRKESFYFYIFLENPCQFFSPSPLDKRLS